MSRQIRVFLIFTAAVFAMPYPGMAGAAAAVYSQADRLQAETPTDTFKAHATADALKADGPADTLQSDTTARSIEDDAENGYVPLTTWAPAGDIAVFRALNRGAENRLFDLLMPFITDFDNWRIPLLVVWLCLMIFGRARGRWAAVLLIVAVAASDQICASVLKPLVGRLRPCEVLGEVHFWSDTEGWITTPAELARRYKTSFSFPSNHASNMTAAMLLLGLVYRKALPWLLLVALSVAYSRIYVGVHWPIDVLSGMVIGASIATLAYLVHRRLGRSRWRAVE